MMETACVFCEVGTETSMFIRATAGPYPEPDESNRNLLTIQCVVLHYGQYETGRCNCALVGCLLNDTVSDAGVASSYWIMMNNELQMKRPWPIIMHRKLLKATVSFRIFGVADRNRRTSRYSADRQPARCGESERHLVLAGGSSTQQASGPNKQTNPAPCS